VLLAAMTTALGVVPIIPDIFWKAMAVTIMGGLTFGSILTLVIVPVYWVIFYRTKTPDKIPPAA
jgi:multidrug efflux pump subunit AcrB